MASSAQRAVVRLQYKKIEGTTCAYCGLYADSEDHVVPASVMGVGGFSLLVPACRECNCLASDSVYLSFNAKLEHVRSALRKRYDRTLAIPDYDVSELMWEADTVVLDKMKALRERAQIQARLTHHHSYEFSNIDEVMLDLDLTRKCPECGVTITYCHKYALANAEKANTSCQSCRSSKSAFDAKVKRRKQLKLAGGGA
jgi:hypothetical protein